LRRFQKTTPAGFPRRSAARLRLAEQSFRFRNLTRINHRFSYGLSKLRTSNVWEDVKMTKTNIFRTASLAAVMFGALAAPTPASATVEELRECLHNCYIAYVVMTQQPSFYQMCAHDCIILYDNISLTSTAAVPLGVTRYN
jgi:long-subunit acyl-CoA synthetase (AMP-forming)